jgi:hypothetical protein
MALEERGLGPLALGPSSQFKNNYFAEICSGSEEGSYLRRIDSCIPQRKAQGPSRTCNESKEEEAAFMEDAYLFLSLRSAPSVTRAATCFRIHG